MGLDNDLLLTLGTLKSLSLIDNKFPEMDNSVFENVKSASESIRDSNEMNDFEFSTSNMIMDEDCNWIRGVFLERRNTEKEKKLQDIEEKLAQKYTQSVFQDNI